MNKDFKIPCCYCDSTSMTGRNFDITCCPWCYAKHGRINSESIKDGLLISKIGNHYWFKGGYLFALELSSEKFIVEKKWNYNYPHVEDLKLCSNDKLDEVLKIEPTMTKDYKKWKMKAFW